MFSYSDSQKIGVLLTVIALIFALLGVILFLDRGLLALSNILFVAGVIMAIGPGRAGRFFFQRRKLRGSILFIFGFVLILVKWTFVGMICECFGFVNLFGDFFPIFFAALRRTPIIGPLLMIPGVKQFVDRVFIGESLPL